LFFSEHEGKESKSEGSGPWWLQLFNAIKEQFGFQLAFEVLAFIGGFPVSIYIARTYFDKEKKAPEAYWLTGWILTGGWYFYAIYSGKLVAHQKHVLIALLSLTLLWTVLLARSLYSQRGKLSAALRAAKRLEDRSLYREASAKYLEALSNPSLKKGQSRYLRCLCQLGDCAEHLNDMEGARMHFQQCLAAAVEARNAHWQSRAQSGLGHIDFFWPTIMRPRGKRIGRPIRSVSILKIL
jgi:hypothetical protein